MSIEVDRTGLITSNGVYLGSIDAGGSVFSVSQEFVGTIRDDGTVFSAKKGDIGNVDRDGNVFSEKKGYIGQLRKDGTIVSLDGYGGTFKGDPQKVGGILLLLFGGLRTK